MKDAIVVILLVKDLGLAFQRYQGGAMERCECLSSVLSRHHVAATLRFLRLTSIPVFDFQIIEFFLNSLLYVLIALELPRIHCILGVIVFDNIVYEPNITGMYDTKHYPRFIESTFRHI